MDVYATRTNCLTGGHVTGAMIPIHCATDKEVLGVVLQNIGLTEPPDARLMWIRNTLDVAELEGSVAYMEEALSVKIWRFSPIPAPCHWTTTGCFRAWTRCSSRWPEGIERSNFSKEHTQPYIGSSQCIGSILVAIFERNLLRRQQAFESFEPVEDDG